MTPGTTGRVWLAQAKINLALHVTARRADGYHDLDTLVVFADCGDRLTVWPSKRLQLAVGGPFADRAPGDSTNLALKAAWALWTATDRGKGVEVALEKSLPVGAGLGGGSADAAAVLQALNALWGLSLGEAALAAIGRTLGADVPICMRSRAIRARGAGETIEPVTGMPELPLVLAWPGVPLATADVFAALETAAGPPLPDLPLEFSGPEAVAAWLAGTENQLYAAAAAIVPAINDALSVLCAATGCLTARMSGSGSACFGLFATREAAEASAAALAAAHPHWWVRAVTAR